MDRRDFIALMAAAGGAPALGLLPGAALAEMPAPAAASVQTKSRAAFQQLIQALSEIDLRYLGPERHITQPQDIADGHRLILHLLSAGLELIVEADPERPVFRRMVSPIRKFLGDNPDAIYFSTYLRPDRSYRIRGNIAGAAYTSISLGIGDGDGRYPTGVAKAISDKEMTVAPDGSYEIVLGPAPQKGNWFKLEPDIGSIITRHYFEAERSIAADPSKTIPLSIECLEPTGPKPAPTDESVAAGITRLTNWVRGATIDQPPLMTAGKVPSWVSVVPNRFNPPGLPDGSIGFANRDAHYAMAPYALKPDEALVIEGRFPKCRFGNVVLWNRFLQTYDYDSHQTSLNRLQTRLEADGSFRMIVAHADPHLPNWLDTEGRPSGLIYWRFVFPEEPIQPIAARVVPFASLAAPR